MKDWKEQFDDEFKFTGIEHQLEGLALSEDLKAFIQSLLEEVIGGIPDKLSFYGSEYDHDGDMKPFKKQLKAKWLV